MAPKGDVASTKVSASSKVTVGSSKVKVPSQTSPTSSSSSTGDGLVISDMGESAERVLAELRRTALQLEPLRGQDTRQILGYRPTYRAILARHGYLVRNTLGAGSYSRVKRALSFKSKRVQLAAIKIIDRSKAPKDYQEKFLPRELRLWPQLRHPHLVSLLDFFQEGKFVFMILEYADGGDALRFIQKNGAISESTAKRWLAQVADAVFYMHRMRIAHRDLKLENLLLDWDGSVKLCDFGFVREVTSEQRFSQTYCGSKSYAAPEILMGIPYDPKKSDVWALGVILYILVTGKMPFDETKGRKSLLEEQRQLNLRFSKNKQPPSDLCQALITKMLTWEFKDRPNVDTVLVDNWFIPDSANVISKSDPDTSKTKPTESGATAANATRWSKSLSSPKGLVKLITNK